jgi:(p)ppGpp synthase/HD superfamily hydrolase
MNKDVILISRALDFAARKHVSQRRKGAAQEPYINHLAEVALLLAEATDGEDTGLVIAGLLHDCIEDQGVRVEDLVELFGEDVARLVADVTDDKTLPKAERKQ